MEKITSLAAPVVVAITCKGISNQALLRLSSGFSIAVLVLSVTLATINPVTYHHLGTSKVLGATTMKKVYEKYDQNNRDFVTNYLNSYIITKITHLVLGF